MEKYTNIRQELYNVLYDHENNKDGQHFVYTPMLYIKLLNVFVLINTFDILIIFLNLQSV